MDSDSYGKEFLAIRAYRMAEVTRQDRQLLISEFRKFLKESWWFTPTWMWFLMFSIGWVLAMLNWYPPWARVGGLLLGVWSLTVMSERKGSLEGFQAGYEWGRRDGVCKGLGIDDSEKESIFRLARDLIVEFKVQSGDPDLELGKDLN